MAADPGWGRDFDPDRLGRLELRAWKAYYRRQPARLFALLVHVNREQAGQAYWPKVAQLLRAAYRSLRNGLDDAPSTG